MNKLRSDSAFCQLTPEQIETLEGWLFEERLGYPKVLEKLKAEFGFETSLTAIRRFYKRLEMERSRESLMDAVEMSGLTVEALKGGALKPGVLLLANKCIFELLMQSPVPIKEVTTLLRAITSAEARAMKQTIYDQEQAEVRERERVRKARESWRMTPADLEEEKEELRQERAERKKAREEAKAAKEREKTGVADANLFSKAETGKDQADLAPDVKLEQPICDHAVSPHPGPLPWGEGETTAVVVASDVRKKADVVELGVRCCGSPTRAPGDRPAVKDAEGAWQPSVVEGREHEEDHVREEAENRLAPLNAA